MSRKLATVDFIERSILIHGDKYQYHLAEYVDYKTKLKIVCKIHGVFEQVAGYHLCGKGCPKCARNVRYTLDEVREYLNSIGWELLDNKYNNSHTPIKVMCPKGHITFRRFNNLRAGTKCSICSNNNTKTFEELKDIVEKDGYKILSSKNDYLNHRTKLEFLCNNGHRYKAQVYLFLQGRRCPTCKNNLQKLTMLGKNNHAYKGDVIAKQLPLYETYVDQLKLYNEITVVKKYGLELLGVACAYCGRVFVPSLPNVRARIYAIKTLKGDNNLYCSEYCKLACPTFGRHKYPKGFKKATSREVQSSLRKLVLARDGYKCQICGATNDDAELHCHHITSILQNPIESADLDNCITLCKYHHIKVHKLPGCGYSMLKCK